MTDAQTGPAGRRHRTRLDPRPDESFAVLLGTLVLPGRTALGALARPVPQATRNQAPHWKRLDIHWHGYQARGPGPNEPARARRARLTSGPGLFLRTPDEVGRWLAAISHSQDGLLARWDPGINRFVPMCRAHRSAAIRDMVVDLTRGGRSLYLSVPAPSRHLVIAVEAVTRFECPVIGCRLAGPSRPAAKRVRA